MAYTVSAARVQGNQPYTIRDVLQRMGSQQPPAEIAFRSLNSPPNTHNLGVGQGMSVQGGPLPAVTRAFGLASCASVCFFNSASDQAYVFHANTGQVTHAQFMNAMVDIQAGQAPYNTIYIGYAHLGATDPDYEDTIADFIRWTVPTNNIVQITHLPLGAFGMNNLFQIGY